MKLAESKQCSKKCNSTCQGKKYHGFVNQSARAVSCDSIIFGFSADFFRILCNVSGLASDELFRLERVPGQCTHTAMNKSFKNGIWYLESVQYVSRLHVLGTYCTACCTYYRSRLSLCSLLAPTTVVLARDNFLGKLRVK